MNRLFVLLLLLISLPAVGAQVVVECAGVSTDSGSTRVVLDTSSAISHRIFTLDSPDRVVIDIPNARLVGKLPEARSDDPTLIGLRSGVRNRGDLRVVVDVKHAVRVKSFPASRDGGGGQRLIVELLPVSDALRPQGGRGTARKVSQHSESPMRARSSRARTAIVAIDAGHGGEDPGAIGPGKTREKDITLAIARKLERLIKGESGMRAVMIRDSDTYVSLRERIRRAREYKADLFVSIHADAFNNPEAHGSSVYTLSQGGASSEAANWLADRENSADLIGGVDLALSDELLATVLLDMTQNATIEHSTEAAGAVLGYLKRVGDVHRPGVQRAGFVVLKSPDIPSILVETAFISNRSEEQRLRSNAHQERIAKAVLAGIKTYFAKYPPQGYLSASAEAGLDSISTGSVDSVGSVDSGGLRYVISQGDTLSEIAQRYRVSIRSLRAENGLEDGDYIRVGQVLSIPTGS
ncbi:AMIN domain-containing protein [Thiorhodococcus mannitoliphagus]|uniref:N-acetylmuramoyl-L-alanine amidase AmiC n=1 Tax=Thiorhodococcus mannitoliphagus TaxID=329406 RepID=A0A6P1DRI9_9GAMM|nr:AMIN domain-containing protein [Thiorhodococcus mannitoliphagus]